MVLVLPVRHGRVRREVVRVWSVEDGRGGVPLEGHGGAGGLVGVATHTLAPPVVTLLEHVVVLTVCNE